MTTLLLTCVRVLIGVLLSTAVAEAAPRPATTQSGDLPAPTLPAPTLPPPTRVTFKLNTPLLEAFQRLFRDTSIPTIDFSQSLFIEALKGVTVTAEIIDQPFMLALLNLCRQGSLEPSFNSAPGLSFSFRRPSRSSSTRPSSTTNATTRATTLRTSWDPATPARPSWIDGPTAVGGPVVFVAGGAIRTSQADLEASSNVTQTLELSLIALRDPTLRLYGVADKLVIDEAIDETGQSLRIEPAADDEQTRPRLRPEADRYHIPLTASLAYSETSRSLKKLRGHWNATLVARTEPIEIIRDGVATIGDGGGNGDGIGGGEKRAGDIRFNVGKLQETGDGVRLPLVLHFKPAGDVWSEVRALTSRDGFRIVEPKGVRYRVEVNIHSQRNDRLEGWVQFRPNPARGDAPKPPKTPTKVIWDVPVEVSDVSIPVEFKDLPLP
ncbi:MAG: hypothetical protein ABIP55_11755 [Tepidisphaeraceae bacterium]